VNIGPRRAEDDSIDFSPNTSRCTHTAGLQSDVESGAGEIFRLRLLTQLSQRDDFRMGGRIVPHFSFVVAGGDDLTIAHDDAADLARARGKVACPGLFDGGAHEVFIGLGGGVWHRRQLLEWGTGLLVSGSGFALELRRSRCGRCDQWGLVCTMTFCWHYKAIVIYPSRIYS